MIADMDLLRNGGECCSAVHYSALSDGVWLNIRASNEGSRRFHNYVEGPYYGLHMVSHLRHLLRHYAEQA